MLVLSELHIELNNMEKALELTETALAIREAKLPPDHPDIGSAFSLLAAIFDQLGKYTEAKRAAGRAIEILDKGTNNLDLIGVFNTLGRINSQEGNYQLAGPAYAQALELAKEVLGPEHPRVGGLLNNIAVLHVNKGELQDALDYYFQAMSIWEKAYGPNHSAVALTLGNIASCFADIKQYEKAIDTLQRVMRIHKMVYGPVSNELAVDYITMARALVGQGKLTEALASYKKGLAMTDKVKTLDVDLVGANIDTLGTDFLSLKIYPEAEKIFKFMLTWWDRAEEPDPRDKIRNLKQLADIMRATNREQEAGEMEARSKEIQEQMNRETGS